LKIFYFVPLFFLASIFFGMIGIGGGVLYTPLQIFLGIPVHNAVATSLFIIVFSATSATVVYAKNRKIDLKLALILETATAIGAFTAGYLSKYVPERFIVVLFSIVLFTVAIMMIRGSVFRTQSKKLYPKYLILWHREFMGEKYTVPLLLAIPISVVAGSVASLCGIAGGTVKVPLMVLLFGVPMDIAIGTSTFMIAVTALSGLLGHAISGHFQIWAVPLGLSVLIGGNIGARIAIKTSKGKLRKIFGYFLLFVSLTMLFRTFFHK